MKKSRRTYNGVHLNKKSNTQDVVEQSLTFNDTILLFVIKAKLQFLFFSIMCIYKYSILHWIW